MKKLILAATASLAAVATAEPLTTTTEIAKSNTIILENTVEIFSSRQNVWVCGLGIRNVSDNVGSDNRVYFTATRYKKGRNELATNYGNGGSKSLVLEAHPTNPEQWRNFNFSMNPNHETRISNIRVELASLNYGAEIRVDYCGEVPFAYEDMDILTKRYNDGKKYPNSDYNDNHANTINRYMDLKVDGIQKLIGMQGLRSQDYILNADLTFGFDGALYDLGKNNQKRIVTPETDTSLSNNTDAIEQEGKLDNGKIEFDAVGENLEIDITLYDVRAGGWDDIKKWKISTFLTEEVGYDGETKRLKALTEAVKWRTTLKSKLNIVDCPGNCKR